MHTNTDSKPAPNQIEVGRRVGRKGEIIITLADGGEHTVDPFTSPPVTQNDAMLNRIAAWDESSMSPLVPAGALEGR